MGSSCSDGIQYRTAYCALDGKRVANEFCRHLTQLQTHRSCKMHECNEEYTSNNEILSPGVIVAIVFVIIVMVLVIGIVLYYFFWKKENTNASRDSLISGEQPKARRFSDRFFVKRMLSFDREKMSMEIKSKFVAAERK